MQRLGTTVLVFLTACVVRAGDWPQFLGPDRNGADAGAKVADAWPAGGPPVVWKYKVGQGFAAPVVAGGKLVLFHRIGGEEVVECLSAEAGKPLWKGAYATRYVDDFGFDEGPRATPAVAGDHVFTFGAEGVLSCWDLNGGARLWSVDTKAQFHPDKGFFGMACSPLVEGNTVLQAVGGKAGACVVAFDKGSGRVLWKAVDDEAGYASPVAATLGGTRCVLAFTRSGLFVLDPADGAVRSSFRWRSRSHASVNAATPLVIGDRVFLSASYGTGAVLLDLKDPAKPTPVWSGDESMSNHYATSVQHSAFLYGFDGRQEETPRLRCVELDTGKVRWTQESFGAGTLILAGDKLLILTEKGELVLAPATPEAFKPLARARVLESECRAHAALADGLFYARDKNTLVCVDLRAGK